MYTVLLPPGVNPTAVNKYINKDYGQRMWKYECSWKILCLDWTI